MPGRGEKAEVSQTRRANAATLAAPAGNKSLPLGFASQAWTTLSQSLASIRNLAEAIALALIALAPWLTLGLILFGPPVLLFLRLSRRVRVDAVR